MTGTVTRRLAPRATEAAGAGPGLDPESPYESLRARIAIFVVAGGLSLLLALSSDHTVFGGLDGYPWGLRAADVAFGLVGYVALWWRRRWPLAFAAYILVISVFSTLSGGLAFVAAFTVAVHRNWPTALVTSALLTLAAWPSLVLYTSGGTTSVGVLMVVVAVLMLAATGWGMFIRARRQLLASLRGRAERAERSREEHARLARIAERQRIAREMHDVLAHRLSLLATYAGAIEYRPDAPPEQVARAAGVVRAGAHQALDELRDVITVLREDDADGDGAQRPQPGLADLPRLLEESRDAGARVQLDDRVPDPAALPGAAGRTAYRVVQEGLTNARKHAPGEPVQVVVDGRPGGGLLIEIRNPLVNGHVAEGAGAAGGAATAGGAGAAGPVIGGSGSGLIGLTERVRLAGGELDHQATDGEFRLSARLPWPA